MGPNHVLSFSYLSSELRGLLPGNTLQALACDLVCNSVLTQSFAALSIGLSGSYIALAVLSRTL